ncbi:MAG: phosphatase PAP2 family protein [Oscillospiraceae bacterium]|nr:phosphatase PAP2 family protein [Oscillospiraceae bacterium]
MKKPVVDLRQFRLSKLNDPQFSHLLLLLSWFGYFAMYFLTETFIPRESCHVVHCALDDIVPFCEWFVIPYVFWYLLVFGSLVYFAVYNPNSFRNLQWYIIITQIVAMAVYILYPNRQDLRPDVMPRENALTAVISFLYSFDTSTNVCPSLHVAYSLGIASVWLKEKDVSVLWKIAIVVMVILICLSTSFIKQHSVVDILAALPLGVLAEILVYRVRWRKKA